jgi:hypothetical protein
MPQAKWCCQTRGLSGQFADLQSFASNAVAQHFARSLNRVPGTDFRFPTPQELNALAAYQNTLVSPADENFDEANQFNLFLTSLRGERSSFERAPESTRCSSASPAQSDATSDANRWRVPEFPPNGAQRKRPQASIAKLPDMIKVCLHDVSFSIELRDSRDQDVLRKARSV